MTDTLPTTRPARARRRRWWRWAGLALLLVALWSLTSLLASAGPLREGRTSLQEARRALLAGDLPAATTGFDDAREAFGRAASAGGWGPGFLPMIGNHHDAVVALGRAGVSLAGAGSTLVEGLESVPGGIDGLAPTAQGLPLDAYAALQASVAAAAEQARAAADTLADAPSGYLAGPVASARFDAEAQAADAAEALEAGAALLEGLPRFAGGDGPRRYLVVSANPAEQRGTGGIWGAYATLTFRQGRPMLSGAAATRELPDIDIDRIEGLDPAWRRIYDGFGGAASWQNMNMTPDFPSAARAALANLAAGGAGRYDGVISADPMALRELLEVTGPVPVPGTSVRVSSDDVVEFTTNEAYSAFSGSAERKEVLGAVAGDVLARFLSTQGRAVPRLRALAGAVAGGNLQVYSTDDAFERALVRAGAAGSFVRPEGDDMVGVTVNNGSGNKVDFYADRTVDATIRLGGDHEAFGTMAVSIENGAPTAGQPRYVLGPFVDGLDAGDASPLIWSWCPEPCELLAATRDGSGVAVESQVEQGMRSFRDYRPITAGATGSYTVDWHTTGVWHGEPWDGRYELHLPGQPTIRPTTTTVTIVAPPGSAITWASDGMVVEGDRATWTGTPGAATTLQVRFRAGPLTRWWRTLTSG
jgi:hypothetical protein